MRAEGISFRHAVELLREDHLPLAVNPSAKPPRISTVPKLPAPVSRDADDRALLLQVVSYYNETLKKSPEALKYLEARGLKSSGDDRPLPTGLRESHAWLSVCRQEPSGRRGDARALAEARPLSRERPRALQRLAW